MPEIALELLTRSRDKYKNTIRRDPDFASSLRQNTCSRPAGISRPKSTFCLVFFNRKLVCKRNFLFSIEKEKSENAHNHAQLHRIMWDSRSFFVWFSSRM